MDGPYGSSQVSFVAAQRQTLAEPPKAIHFQDIQLQHGLPAARVCPLQKPEVTSRTPKVRLQYRGHGSRAWRLESVCTRVKSHGPRGRRSSPPSARRPLEPRCIRNLSSMRPVCGVWQRSLVWASQITGMGKSGTARDRCWGKLWGRDMPPSLALAFTRPRRRMDKR